MLGHPPEDVEQEVPAAGEQQPFAAVEDPAMRGGAGRRFDLAGQCQRLLDDEALEVGIDRYGDGCHGHPASGETPPIAHLARKCQRTLPHPLVGDAARVYLPTSGVWLTPDPLGLGVDVNPYRYVGNGPTNATDPSGMYLHLSSSAKAEMEKALRAAGIRHEWNGNSNAGYFLWVSPEDQKKLSDFMGGDSDIMTAVFSKSRHWNIDKYGEWGRSAFYLLIDTVDEWHRELNFRDFDRREAERNAPKKSLPSLEEALARAEKARRVRDEYYQKRVMPLLKGISNELTEKVVSELLAEGFGSSTQDFFLLPANDGSNRAWIFKRIPEEWEFQSYDWTWWRTPERWQFIGAIANSDKRSDGSILDEYQKKKCDADTKASWDVFNRILTDLIPGLNTADKIQRKRPALEVGTAVFEDLSTLVIVGGWLKGVKAASTLQRLVAALQLAAGAARLLDGLTTADREESVVKVSDGIIRLILGKFEFDRYRRLVREAEEAEKALEQARKNRMSLARELGREGETAAGITSPKTGVRGPISGRMRFPDELTATLLKEIKNVAKQALTAQLKDYIAIANNLGIDFELWIRSTTRITKPLQEAIKRGDIIPKIIPGK